MLCINPHRLDRVVDALQLQVVSRGVVPRLSKQGGSPARHLQEVVSKATDGRGREACPRVEPCEYATLRESGCHRVPMCPQ